MPFHRERYPREWEEVSRFIRFERAQHRCECTGRTASRVLCGLHCTHPGPRRCVEVNHTPAVWARGLIVLTVAHVCDCEPLCADPEHLLAMCQRCHIRTDITIHMHHAAEHRRFLRQQAGQLTFLPETPLYGEHR
jgi:hypothetical protein